MATNTWKVAAQSEAKWSNICSEALIQGGLSCLHHYLVDYNIVHETTAGGWRGSRKWVHSLEIILTTDFFSPDCIAKSAQGLVFKHITAYEDDWGQKFVPSERHASNLPRNCKNNVKE